MKSSDISEVMDRLIKGANWNWQHKKTYAVMKSGAGYIDVDVVSKYRLDSRSASKPKMPPKTPTKPKVPPKAPPKVPPKVPKVPPKVPPKRPTKPPTIQPVKGIYIFTFGMFFTFHCNYTSGTIKYEFIRNLITSILVYEYGCIVRN